MFLILRCLFVHNLLNFQLFPISKILNFYTFPDSQCLQFPDAPCFQMSIVSRYFLIPNVHSFQMLHDLECHDFPVPLLPSVLNFEHTFYFWVQFPIGELEPNNVPSVQCFWFSVSLMSREFLIYSVSSFQCPQFLDVSKTLLFLISRYFLFSNFPSFLVSNVPSLVSIRKYQECHELMILKS